MDINKGTNSLAAFMDSFKAMEHLPELRNRLEVEMADHPYQLIAVYQRHRHNAQKCEYWPDKPESAPAVSRYPNILAELDVSGMWIDRIARYAKVSMELMAAAMEDNGELSFMELRGLTHCFGCKMFWTAKRRKKRGSRAPGRVPSPQHRRSERKSGQT